MKHFKLILFLWLTISITGIKSYGQCSGGTQVGTKMTICSGGTTSSLNVTANNYFLLNVVGGLQYTISNSGLGITVRDSAGTTQIQNTTTQNLTFTAPSSGVVRVYNCSGGFNTLTVVLAGGSNNVDNQSLTSNNQWVEHFYDVIGTNFPPSDANAFGRYLGYYKFQPESFDESFAGAATCIGVFSQDVQRINLYTEAFAARLRMNSTKDGLYTVTLGSEDGARLTVDGTKVYDRWATHTYAENTNVLINLNGNSNLLYEYYDNTGANRLSFKNLTKMIDNIVTGDTAQRICQGAGAGTQLTGDAYIATLPSGITKVNTTGFQWAYSTTPGGTLTDIVGATAQNFTPSTANAPFNNPGTYYLYRKAILQSINNTGATTSPYIATNISNAAKITIRPTPNATISGTTAVCKNVTAPNITFTNSVADTVIVTYNINGGTNQTINISPSTTATVAAPTGTAGTFAYNLVSVSYKTAPACTRTLTGSATVTVRETPNGSLSTTTSPICQGQQAKLTFTSSVAGSPGPYTLIINGQTYSSITSGTAFNITPNPTTTTTYNLTKITDNNGCVLQSP